MAKSIYKSIYIYFILKAYLDDNETRTPLHWPTIAEQIPRIDDRTRDARVIQKGHPQYLDNGNPNIASVGVRVDGPT